jgi:hypothetical protein
MVGPPTPGDVPSDDTGDADGDAEAPAADAFEEALATAFDATDPEVRVVARQARDLAATGRYRDDTGRDLTPAVVVEHLSDAPDDGLPPKWNWWLGSLELAYGGYATFGVRAVERE